jgi:hypothetical protein
VDALYEPLGDGRVRPGPLTRGPWDPRAQHGGAPAALLGGAVERVSPGEDMRVTRVTFELLRPVPLDELRVETELVRPGRRVQLVAARLWAGDTLVVSALALRLRRAPGASPEVGPPEGTPQAPPLPGEDAIKPFPRADGGPTFATHGMEIRFASGSYAEPGTAFAWMRLRAPVLDGEPPSPLQRALAAGDFGNGIASVLDWGEHVFINPDLTVHLEREPEGEWIGLDSETTIAPDGSGQATSSLYDARGRFGRAVQALFVDPR